MSTTLSERLERLRDKRGISRRAVAVKIHEPSASVNLWFTGGAEPKFSAAAKLAELFEVSLDSLAGKAVRPDDLTPGERAALTVLRALRLSGDEAIRRLSAGGAAEPAHPDAEVLVSGVKWHNSTHKTPRSEEKKPHQSRG